MGLRGCVGAGLLAARPREAFLGAEAESTGEWIPPWDDRRLLAPLFGSDGVNGDTDGRLCGSDCVNGDTDGRLCGSDCVNGNLSRRSRVSNEI